MPPDNQLTFYRLPLPWNEEKSNSKGSDCSTTETQDEYAPQRNSIKSKHCRQNTSTYQRVL